MAKVNDSRPKNYEVGYGKPPKHTRFTKGQSGNRKGRPKAARNLKAQVLQELEERITVREGTLERPITKQRAVIKAIVAKAIKGDMRAAHLLLNMVIPLQDAAAAQTSAAELTQDDKKLVELLIEYQKEQGKLP